MSDYLWDKAGRARPRGRAARAAAAAARPIAAAAALAAATARAAHLGRRRAWWRRRRWWRCWCAAVAPVRQADRSPRSWAVTVRRAHDGRASTAARSPARPGFPSARGSRPAPAARSLRVADIGTVELAPGTRARIVATGPTAARARSSTAARCPRRIDAPPRQLRRRDTPHAVVIDLGCAFKLTVDESGAGPAAR